MSSVLRDSARTLADTLVGEGDDVQVVHDHVPEGFVAPCIVLQPADRYVVGAVGGETFAGEYQQVIDVFCLVPVESNEQAANDADELLEHVLEHLDLAVWGVDAVNRPGPITTDTWRGHGVRVTVSRFITL